MCLDLGKVSALSRGEVRPHEHVPEPLLHVGPEEVLGHGLAAVVDTVDDVDDARAKQRGGDVEVVHERVQQLAEVHQVGGAVLLQVLGVVGAGMALAAAAVDALHVGVRHAAGAVAGDEDEAVRGQTEQVPALAVQSQALETQK